MCIPCCYTISTSEVGVIEKWGKFTRLSQPGLGVIMCPMEKLVGRLSFRVQQIDVRVETKTLDNVFLTAVVSVQYQVLRENVYEAFYALTNPVQQITAHVYDVMRSTLPTLELDAAFEAKEELASSVKNALSESFTSYGYQILQTLITDLDPAQSVKNAMNEINSSKRLKFSVAERAEGKKILRVKSAEAGAEALYLSGVGVSRQRKAIVDGLRDNIVDFSHGTTARTKDVMDLLLLTQYFDMIRDVGSAAKCRTTFVPMSRSSGDEIRCSLLQADAATKKQGMKETTSKKKKKKAKQ
ncbi:Band_7-domain-containing protein [Fragilariopsis cylindrus CCMP1102]|uniref:Band_7-domain-containing protein n=1 Tax=Fragilariopsis cylindrus CCMP1102 TaxID=635003 RepID=A0A1E7FIF9_9STRA|nr:Band_7-domain-containing protein [Fragilariopsis cylindrus CCMP1102]|eukprot:OEU17914.1 Band_7-domain-containing protein [Fragilariopsis cylindrus CCMP1102]